MPDREKVIEGLKFTKAMITFNPSTGEDIEPGNLNEADKTSYDACVGAITLLKEQEIGHWISLENCSNSGVYCSECHTKVFDSYPFKKKFSYFCPHCGTRMEGETERQ